MFLFCYECKIQGDLPFPSPKNMTPEAVEQAMKVLEIHERLEHPGQASDSDESTERLGYQEVEVLKEMCNVSVKGPFWRVFVFPFQTM